jgi:hypothetical protein
MADLTPQSTAVVGTTLTNTAPTATTGDWVPCLSAKVFVKNASGSSINVTVVTPGNDAYGNARPDIVTAVAAGADALFGPFPLDLGDSTHSNMVNIICSAVTSVTLHVVAED